MWQNKQVFTLLYCIKTKFFFTLKHVVIYKCAATESDVPLFCPEIGRFPSGNPRGGLLKALHIAINDTKTLNLCLNDCFANQVITNFPFDKTKWNCS